MGWFESNADALKEAGISEAQAADWLTRNPGDESRLIQANTNYTGDRQFDSQGPEINNGNGAIVRAPNQAQTGGGGGNSLGNWANATNTSFEYTPFTEQFTAPTAPADLMTPWGRTFTPTARPADLGEKWDKTY